MLSGHQRPHSNKCTEQSNHQISVKVKVLHLHIYLQNKAESRMEEMEGAVQTILVFFLVFISYIYKIATYLTGVPISSCIKPGRTARLDRRVTRLDYALALGWTRHYL